MSSADAGYVCPNCNESVELIFGLYVCMCAIDREASKEDVE